MPKTPLSPAPPPPPPPGWSPRSRRFDDALSGAFDPLPGLRAPRPIITHLDPRHGELLNSRGQVFLAGLLAGSGIAYLALALGGVL